MLLRCHFFRWLETIGGVALLVTATHAAPVVLIDPANLAIGSKVGENLEVRGYCPNNKNDCLPEEKVKYISAVSGRVGQIEFDVNLTDNFELDVNAYFYSSNRQTITLYKIADDNSGSLFIQYAGYPTISFNDDDRWNYARDVGWNGGKINDVELLAKSGVAYLNINGVAFKDSSGNEGDTVNLDTSRPFIKLAITNIQSSDQLYEITLKGGDSTSSTTTTTTPTTTTTTTVPTTTSSSNDNCIAEYVPTTGSLKVPCVMVPVVSPFGGLQAVVYNVQMQQQSGGFAFDLDLSSVKQRLVLTPSGEYVADGKTCTDVRIDEYDETGTTIVNTQYKTNCK